MRFEDRKTEFVLVVGVLVAPIAALYATGQLGTAIQLFTDPQYLRETAASYQEFGVFVLLGLQIVNNVLAPLPGQGIGVAYGLLYGAFWGTVFGMIGTTIGTTIAILVSKRYGRPLVVSVIGQKRFDKYSQIIESTDVWPFVILIVLPVIPDDAIAYIAGLSSLDTKRLIFWLSAARFPGMLALAWFGGSMAAGDLVLLAGITFVVLVVSVWVVWKRTWIMNKLSTPSPSP